MDIITSEVVQNLITNDDIDLSKTKFISAFVKLYNPKSILEINPGNGIYTCGIAENSKCHVNVLSQYNILHPLVKEYFIQYISIFIMGEKLLEDISNIDNNYYDLILYNTRNSDNSGLFNILFPMLSEKCEKLIINFTNYNNIDVIDYMKKAKHLYEINHGLCL